MMASNFVKVNTVIKRLEDEKRTKSPNTLKQFAAKLPTNCLSVFDHFVGLALKGLSCYYEALDTKNILLQATSHEWFQKQSSKNP